MTGSFPFIKIAGAPFERGQSYGLQAKALIERAIGFYRGSFEARGLDWRRVIQIGEGFGGRVAAYSEDMFEELRGIAFGAGRALGEIVALNARTEFLHGAAGVEDAQAVGGEGCTGAILLGEATANGHVLHCQNWDWLRPAADITLMLEIEPDCGPRILTLVEAGTLARCGLNSSGLAITGNFLKGDESFNTDGVPAPFVRRKVLSSTNMHDAMLAVTTAKRSFSINVMISDAGGEAIDFETMPDRLFWMRPENGILVHANHFSSPGALAAINDLSLQVTPDSLFRERRTLAFLQQRRGQITLQDIKTIFADRYGEPYGICRSAGGPNGDGSVTVATVLMDVTARQISVARTPYDGASFETFTLADASKA